MELKKKELGIVKSIFDFSLKKKLITNAIETYNHEGSHLFNYMLTPSEMHMQNKYKENNTNQKS